MNKISITWGTCWFNENVDSIIQFFKESNSILKENDLDVELILFDARYHHNYDDINKIKQEVGEIKILLNKTNIFPNKNYGISIITRESRKLNTDYIAIVDPDWKINDMGIFIKQLIKNLKSNDVLIPNIKSASGRSNVLIGNTAMSIFFPEYKDIIASPFPGALVANTEKLYEIINDSKYNFDWGGEWDIIALAIEKKMKLSSVKVDVKGIRHRSNKSKMNDSFQIWKAILSNEFVIKQISNNIDNDDFSSINLYNKLENIYDIKEMIRILEEDDFSKTERQFLYMILYPIAVFYNKIDIIPKVKEFSGLPYERKKLLNISKCIINLTNRIILSEYECSNNNKNNSSYYSKWNRKNMDKALKNYEVI